jgi:hypothetical protein
MGSRFRVLLAAAAAAAVAVCPAVALGNSAGAPADTGFGRIVANGAQTEGGIGSDVSIVARQGLMDDAVHRLLGLTPPGNPPKGGPIPPPICGPGCGATA